MGSTLKRLVLAAVACMVCGIALAQNLRDCVYLKNGSIIKGTILEQIPNEKIKIQTGDGSVFVYEFDQVEKITRELIENASYSSYSGLPNAAILSYAGNGKVLVVEGDTRMLLTSDSPDLSKYMPLQYDSYVQGVKRYNYGVGLVIAGLALNVIGAACSDTDAIWILGPVCYGAGTIMWLTGIPIWCLGTSQQKNTISMSNAYRGCYNRYSLELSPSFQKMGTGAITGRNETAVGATLAFRF